jgi:hypothetical protein
MDGITVYFLFWHSIMVPGIESLEECNRLAKAIQSEFGWTEKEANYHPTHCIPYRTVIPFTKGSAP